MRRTCTSLAAACVLFSAVPTFAESHHFVCSASEPQLREAISRYTTGPTVVDYLLALIPNCGGAFAPGDTVTVEFVLAAPIALKAIGDVTLGSWTVGGGLQTANYDGGAGIGEVQGTLRVNGANVVTSPTPVQVFVTGPGIEAEPLPITSISIGAGSHILLVDPSKDAVIEYLVVQFTAPLATMYGGATHSLSVPSPLTTGGFGVTSSRWIIDPNIPIGPTISVGTPASKITVLEQQTVILLQTEALAASVVGSLTTKLSAALTALAQEQLTSAAGQLRAYVNQVNGLVNAGTISEDAAEALTTAAVDLISRIRPRK